MYFFVFSVFNLRYKYSSLEIEWFCKESSYSTEPLNSVIITANCSCSFYVAERVVEDHEDILQVYKHMESYPKPIVKKFIFRKDFRKYEVFTDPQVSNEKKFFFFISTVQRKIILNGILNSLLYCIEFLTSFSLFCFQSLILRYICTSRDMKADIFY